MLENQKDKQNYRRQDYKTGIIQAKRTKMLIKTVEMRDLGKQVHKVVSFPKRRRENMIEIISNKKSCLSH